MSFIQNESTDSNDIENQFNSGIKMIVNAYETQTTYLSNEIIKLTKDLEEKQNKINELQELCQKLLNQKNSYENNIKNLKTENEQIKEQLNNVIIENNELKRVKQNILATIENTNNNNSLNSVQIKHNTKTLEQIYKNNSYKILNGRNKLKEEYNNSQNNANNKSLSSKGYTERLFKTTLKKGKTPINVNNFFNQNNKFFNDNNNNKFDNNSVNNDYIKNKNIKNIKSFSVEKILNNTYSNRNFTKQNSPNRINYLNNNNNSFSRKNTNDNNSNETDFFKKCREIMNSTDYANMLDIVHMFNSKQINKQDTYTNIFEILQKGGYNSLIEGFNNLFS
jgi:hypothetical protein